MNKKCVLFCMAIFTIQSCLITASCDRRLLRNAVRGDFGMDDPVQISVGKTAQTSSVGRRVSVDLPDGIVNSTSRLVIFSEQELGKVQKMVKVENQHLLGLQQSENFVPATIGIGKEEESWLTLKLMHGGKISSGLYSITEQYYADNNKNYVSLPKRSNKYSYREWQKLVLHLEESCRKELASQ